MKIVCVGDSITAGQYVSEEFHWPRLLGATAYGVSNETSRDGRLRFDRIPLEDADVVLVQFGHNDANRWGSLGGHRRVPVDEYVENLAMMRAAAYYQGVPARVIVPHETSLSETYRRDLEEYVAAAQTFVRWTRVSVDPERHLLDGLHLNEEGHRHYAAALSAVL